MSFSPGFNHLTSEGVPRRNRQAIPMTMVSAPRNWIELSQFEDLIVEKLA